VFEEGSSVVEPAGCVEIGICYKKDADAHCKDISVRHFCLVVKTLVMIRYSLVAIANEFIKQIID